MLVKTESWSCGNLVDSVLRMAEHGNCGTPFYSAEGTTQKGRQLHLVSFDGGFGRVEGHDVIPMGSDMIEFLRTGESQDRAPMALSSVSLRVPIPAPSKIIAVGLNYRDHAAETGTPIPVQPPLFAKYANSLLPDGGLIVVPRETQQPDYEGELGVVIGRQARRVRPDEALSLVAGYCCINDVSARDLQMETGQWMRGKAIDTFLPCGPWLVTSDEIPDPQSLGVRTWVNGDLRQSSSTQQMIWSVADLVSILSQTMTLEPGDILATGTPPGVGVARQPPVFLADGDLVEIEIERIGRLSNRVTLE